MPGIHAPNIPAPTKTPCGGPSDQPRNFASYRKQIGEQEAQAAREKREALQNARADAAALWALAEMSTPPDLREFGMRHKIENFAVHAWQTAFMAGWRAAMAAKEMPDA